MTTIPEPTDVHAAQFRALQALGSTANPERQGPKEALRAGYGLICGRTLIHPRALAALSRALKQPPESALRPAHGSPASVDIAVRPQLAARPFVPLSNVTIAIPLDAIPAVTVRALKKPRERALGPAHGSPGRVDMAVRPLATTLRTVSPLNVTTAIPLDAIPAVAAVAQ
jgi:hypothetical protein